jgi:hypothetical protein
VVARRLHRGLGLRAGLGDEGGLLHLGRLLAPDAVQVAHVVGDVLDLQGVELDADAAQVVLGLGEQALGELDLVLVDLLGGEGGQHPRRFPSRVSLATIMICRRSTPRKRSTALSSTGGSPAIFTLAMP